VSRSSVYRQQQPRREAQSDFANWKEFAPYREDCAHARTALPRGRASNTRLYGRNSSYLGYFKQLNVAFPYLGLLITRRSLEKFDIKVVDIGMGIHNVEHRRA
jgi:hypothetical protein